MPNINFSFIIPHKNNPSLLQRCINSIPQREDIEIIVVDDNSNKDIIDWSKFATDNKNVNLILTTESKGAGYARNIGLKRAKGKWLLFADCDDIYLKPLIKELDIIKDQSFDVIYFNYNIESPQKKLISRDHEIVSHKINTFKSEKDIDFIKYKLNAPWNKIVNHEFINKYQIYFEETIQGNDMFFTYQVGYFSKNIHIISTPLYTYMMNSNSITLGNTNIEKLLCMIKGWYKANNFMRFIGHPEWTFNEKIAIIRLIKRNPSLSIKLILQLIKNYNNILRERNKYTSYIQKTINKT